MNKAGLYSQNGFEFQKLVFIYFALQMNNMDEITYEGMDDLDISSQYYPIYRYKFSMEANKFIQVKSGSIDNSTLQKIFLNWLLNFNNTKQYVCFMENELSIDYKNNGFFNSLIEDVKNTTKRRSAIIRQVKDCYDGKEVELKENLKWLIEHAEFETHSCQALNKLSFQLFENTFTNLDEHEVIKESQFEELIKIIRSKLADIILLKQSYTLSHRELFSIISDILARINQNNYDVDFTEFKSNSDSKVYSLLSKNGDSVKQLKLVTASNERIMSFLTEQIFYEDFRAHFFDEMNLRKINNLETLAHSNYENVLFSIEGTADEDNPKAIFLKTTSKELKSELFVANSSNLAFYSRGCYIHLTDTDIDENLKIKWGEFNEDK